MPANHTIDHANRLVITKWTGEPSDNELIEAFKKYNREIKSKPEHKPYNELVVFDKFQGSRISTTGLKMLVEIAEQYDTPGVRTKLAFVVNSNLAYGLTRMYTIYRSFSPKGSKTIHVFKNKTDASSWLSKRD